MWVWREPSSRRRCVWLLVLVLVSKRSGQQSSTQSVADRIQKAKEALNFVEQIAHSKECNGGTGNTLDLTFDTSGWLLYTDPAVRTANYLSELLALHNNTLKEIPDITYFNLVRNNVHGETLIFGSGTAFVEDVLKPGRTRYCPYANRNPDGSVTSFDIAESYDYVNSSTVWWDGPLARNYSDVKVVTDNVTVDQSQGMVRMRTPVANYTHGFWTLPYYDCGGGNIWMVTFCAPVLALDDSGIPIFKGIASSDIELTNIDINQCESEEGDAAGSLDVFRDTHNCQPTTRCVPIKNQGFKRSSYNCECLDGFYFPGGNNGGLRAFRGEDIDNFFDNVNMSSEATTDSSSDAGATYDVASGMFRCLPCARGCVTCVDNTPCLYQTSVAVRVLVVVIVLVLICGCGALSFITFKNRTDLVMKTASPSFLQLMILGSVLMCLSVLLMYPEPDDLLCIMFVWPFHLGFVLLYGSLLLKTWRISVIFTSRRKVNLTDKVLMQRMLLLPALMSLFLAAWSAVKPPHVVTVDMPNTKKFFSCSFDYWNYSVFGAEALMLLVGVYLSFTVRKAPAQFNESKYITWAIYNAMIMGVFIITITQIMANSVGPDVLYVLLMLQLQVFDTIALCLIFAPKIWTLHKGAPPDHTVTMMGPTNLSRQQQPTTRTLYTDSTAHKAVQVNPEDFGPASPANQERPSSGLRSNRVAPMEKRTVTIAPIEQLSAPVAPIEQQSVSLTPMEELSVSALQNHNHVLPDVEKIPPPPDSNQTES